MKKLELKIEKLFEFEEKGYCTSTCIKCLFFIPHTLGNYNGTCDILNQESMDLKQFSSLLNSTREQIQEKTKQLIREML